MTNPALDARPPHDDSPSTHPQVVYVGVHANGPTRVLVFSSTPTEYSQVADDSTGDDLKRQIRTLARQLKAVDEDIEALVASQHVKLQDVLQRDAKLQQLATPTVVCLQAQQRAAVHAAADAVVQRALRWWLSVVAFSCAFPKTGEAALLEHAPPEQLSLTSSAKLGRKHRLRANFLGAARKVECG